MGKDMTKGNPLKLILIFSLPLLIGNMFQQFYNMADTIIVGRTLGYQALAAVGSTGSISFLVLGFANGLCSGFSVVIAQKFGAGDLKAMRNSVCTSVILSAAFTVLLTAISVSLAMPMLRVMNTPEDIIGDAYNYIIIIFVGICASFFYNLLSGILRALGDSKTPLYFLIIASALNIALDFLFILAFKMGVAGAAVATVVAQAVSGFLCLIYMGKKFPILKLNRADWHFDPAFAWTHLKIGLPMALQFSVTAIGVMILQSALNQFGSTTVAAYTAASKVEIIFTQPMVTLGVTTATFTAQNLGARRYDRIKQGVKISCLLAVGATVLAICAALFLGHFFVGLFIDSPTEEMYDVAQQYLNIISIFFIFLSQLYVFRNALQGIGDAFVPFMAGVMELIMRSLACATLPQRLGYTGVCLASPLAWIGAAVPLAITYIIRSKKLFSDTARLTDV